jgi:hypothetical protein
MATRRFLAITIMFWGLIGGIFYLIPPSAEANLNYNVQHNINIRHLVGNLAPEVSWIHDEKSWAEEASVRANAVGPVPSPWVWPLGNPGNLQPPVSTANVTVGGQTGNANSSASINPYGMGNITGQHRVWGNEIVTSPAPARYGAWGGSKSAIGVIYRGQARPNGNIAQRRMIIVDTISGHAGAASWGRGKDPIDFQIFNESTGNTLLQGTLLGIDFAISGAGVMAWGDDPLNPDGFTINAQQAKFTIDLTSQYIPAAQRGSLNLEINGGIITAASDEGVFDGWLPAIGTEGNFARNWTNEISFDFALPEFTGDNITYKLDFSGSGEAGALVPLPASLWFLLSGLARLGLYVKGKKA